MVLRLEGHLTLESLELALASLSVSQLRPLLVDCTKMDSYEAAARERFVEWHREHRAVISGVAVVTDNRLWHMIVSAMSLASGQKMRAFADAEAAHVWLSAPST